MVYRVWSRVIASKYNQGNRPGATSKWVAAYIQTQVELALVGGTEFSAVSLDLTKAYNLLSRPFLKELAPAFEIPSKGSQAYFAFLDNVSRSFRVHGD